MISTANRTAQRSPVAVAGQGLFIWKTMGNLPCRPDIIEFEYVLGDRSGREVYTAGRLEARVMQQLFRQIATLALTSLLIGSPSFGAQNPGT